MRVLVRRDSQDEQGATIVIVALLTTFLLVLSGFTIDFGQAWMAKRNLQKAADAGALAAAQVLAGYPGTCDVVRLNPLAVAEARTAADKYRDKNREAYLPASVVKEWTVDCNAAKTAVVVNYGLEGTTESSFGPLAGTSDTLTADRRAQAIVEVGPHTSTRMRPLAMCSTQLTAGPFVRLDYPKDAPPSCGNASGAWWTVDCPGNPSNSTSVMVSQVRDGCPKGASVVSGQTTTQTTGQLTNTLTAACIGGTTPEGGCLESNPGNLDSGQVAASWKYLVDNNVEAVFPVFCAPPQCTSTTIDGSGNNATFPIYKLVGAVICGYHFSNNEKYHSSEDECTGLPSNMHAGDDDSGNNVNYIVIKYVQISTSGSNEATGCALGSTNGCDGGIRRTRLTN